jgi:hypothetical protein
MYVKINGTDYRSTNNSGLQGVGNWYHVYGHVTQNETVHYVNGQLTGYETYDNIPVSELSGGNLYIGTNDTAVGFAYGDIDDVRIYDRALDPIEVEQLFNKGAYRINRGEL